MDKPNTEETQEKQEAAQQMNLIINKPEDANIEFIDHVQATWNPEVVILSLVQKNQGGVSPSGPDGSVLEGRLVAQAALTWPHVARLRDLLNKAIEENREAVVSIINETMQVK